MSGRQFNLCEFGNCNLHSRPKYSKICVKVMCVKLRNGMSIRVHTIKKSIINYFVYICILCEGWCKASFIRREIKMTTVISRLI